MLKRLLYEYELVAGGVMHGSGGSVVAAANIIAGLPYRSSALSPIPAPGDLFNLLLHLLFGQGVVTFVILSISAFQGWYGMVKKTASGARTAGGQARDIFDAARKLDRINRIFTVTCLITMVVAQGLWLLVNYVIGNVLSAALNVNHALYAMQHAIPNWQHFLSALQWDAVSEMYVLISIIGLVASYVYAKRRKSTDGLATFFSLPGYLYGFCGLVGGTLALGLDLIDHALHHGSYLSAGWIELMYSAGVAGTLYVIGCRFLFRSPATVRNLFSDRHHATTV